MSPGRIAVVVAGALILQLTLLSAFTYEGARPDVMVLLAVMTGFLAGPDRGAIVGFASGMAIDVFLSTPLGLSAFVYTLVGYGVGVASAGVVRSSRWLPVVVAAVGSAAAMLLYAAVGSVLGQPTLEGPPLIAIVVFVAAVNAAFAPLARWALSWAAVPAFDRPRPFFAR